MYYFLNILDAIINILPYRITLVLGVCIGRIVYRIDMKHRNLAISNIKRVFGETKTSKEIRSIAKTSFENTGINLMEFFRDIPKTFEVEGYNHIEHYVNNKEPIIYVLGHFGNWELLGRIAARHGLPITAVGRVIKNKGVDKFIQQKRTGSGLEILGKRGSVNELIRVLKEKRSVGILIDQYAGRKGTFVDFLGIPTSTTPSPAVLALRTDVPIIPSLIVRKKDNIHKIIIYPPVSVDKTGNITTDIMNLTKQLVKPLETNVKRNPEQWWWVHRRWRESSSPFQQVKQ